MQRRHILIVLVSLGLFLVAAGLWIFQSLREDSHIADERGNQKVAVVLTDKGFEPQEIRVSKGTTVLFSTTRNNQFWPASNPHPSHDIYPEFDPKRPIDPHDSWSFLFDRPGIWGYHDHMRSYFIGRIYVEE